MVTDPSDGVGRMKSTTGHTMPDSMTAASDLSAQRLSRLLLGTVTTGLSEIADSAAPDLRLPRIYAGHILLDDTRADLAYVLGLLFELGVYRIAKIDLLDRIFALLEDLDPDGVQGFSSYRVAETVQRIGGLGVLSSDLKVRVLQASHPSKLYSALAIDNSRTPDQRHVRTNWQVVAARCAHALTVLGASTADYESLVRAVRRVFSDSASGWINDAQGSRKQFDIYTPDMYLLAEPFAEELGLPWRRGFERVVADLDLLTHPEGSVTWGRSIGSLSQAMTIEVAAAATLFQLNSVEHRLRWLSRSAIAIGKLGTEFTDGVIDAHRGRATDPYRGSQRRLQLTFDIYGKLLLAARSLMLSKAALSTREVGPFWPPADSLIRFEPSGRSSVWVHRAKALGFVLPLMDGTSVEYLPTPRAPNVLDQSIGGHPLMIPTLARRFTRADGTRVVVSLVPRGTPTKVTHSEHELFVEHTGWATVGGDGVERLFARGSRRVHFIVDGRTLRASETLTFEDTEDGPLSISFAEGPERPLTVEVQGSIANSTVQTGGMPEWRSCWAELTKVHQFELPLRNRVAFSWQVTPWLRVASTDLWHQYNESLYREMNPGFVFVSAGLPDRALADRLTSIDLLHLAWPERWCGTDEKVTREVISCIKELQLPIVWTQHNLVPHRDVTAGAVCYALWAQAADLVIHHSKHGMAKALSTYSYGPETRHALVPHGHWGSQYIPFQGITRADVEAKEGWPPSSLRILVAGQPRREKDLQGVVDAVARCNRPDIQLVARLSGLEKVPSDSRIIPSYGHLTHERYHERLRAVDAMLFPFTTEGMLTTGTAFDCIGAGVAAITSDWGFLDEIFGVSSIRYGSSADDLVHCLEQLTNQQLARSRDAVVARRAHFEWSDIGWRTMGLFEDLVVRHSARLFGSVGEGE